MFAREGASFDHARERARRRPSSQEWAEQGYFTQNFNGVGYDPAWQQFAKGAGPFLIAGTWLLADLTDAMGDKLGFMLVPPARTARRRRRSAARASRSRSRRSRRTRTWRPRTSTSSPTPTPPTCWSRPATCRRCRPSAQPSAAAGEDVFEAWRTLAEADGLVPYLDYATPTFYDTITAEVQRLMAGRRSPDEFTQALQDDYG